MAAGPLVPSAAAEVVATKHERTDATMPLQLFWHRTIYALPPCLQASTRLLRPVANPLTNLPERVEALSQASSSSVSASRDQSSSLEALSGRLAEELRRIPQPKHPSFVSDERLLDASLRSKLEVDSVLGRSLQSLSLTVCALPGPPFLAQTLIDGLCRRATELWAAGSLTVDELCCSLWTTRCTSSHMNAKAHYLMDAAASSFVYLAETSQALSAMSAHPSVSECGLAGALVCASTRRHRRLILACELYVEKLSANMLDTDTLLTLLHATRHSKRRDFYRLLIAALSYRDFDLGQAATLVRIGARARMNVISANCFRRAFEQVSRHSKVLDPETHFELAAYALRCVHTSREKILDELNKCCTKDFKSSLRLKRLLRICSLIGAFQSPRYRGLFSRLVSSTYVSTATQSFLLSVIHCVGAARLLHTFPVFTDAVCVRLLSHCPDVKQIKKLVHLERMIACVEKCVYGSQCRAPILQALSLRSSKFLSLLSHNMLARLLRAMSHADFFPLEIFQNAVQLLEGYATKMSPIRVEDAAQAFLWAGVFYGQPIGRDFIIDALLRMRRICRHRLIATASLAERMSAVRYSLPVLSDPIKALISLESVKARRDPVAVKNVKDLYPMVLSKTVQDPSPKIPSKIEQDPTAKTVQDRSPEIPSTSEQDPSPKAPSKTVEDRSPEVPSKSEQDPSPKAPSKTLEGRSPEVPSKSEQGPSPKAPSKTVEDPSPEIPSKIAEGRCLEVSSGTGEKPCAEDPPDPMADRCKADACGPKEAHDQRESSPEATGETAASGTELELVGSAASGPRHPPLQGAAWAVCVRTSTERLKAIQQEVAHVLRQLGLNCSLQHICKTSSMRIDLALPEICVAMLLLTRMSFLDPEQHRIRGAVALEQRLLRTAGWATMIVPLDFWESLYGDVDRCNFLSYRLQALLTSTDEST